MSVKSTSAKSRESNERSPEIDVNVAMQGLVTMVADAFLEMPGQPVLRIPVTLTANESGLLNVAFRTNAEKALLDFGEVETRRIEASIIRTITGRRSDRTTQTTTPGIARMRLRIRKE